MMVAVFRLDHVNTATEDSSFSKIHLRDFLIVLMTHFHYFSKIGQPLHGLDPMIRGGQRAHGPGSTNDRMTWSGSNE